MKLMPQLVQYYKLIHKESGENLVNDSNDLNLNFFKELVYKISCIEHSYYKKILKNIHRVRREGNNRADSNEENLNEYEIDINRFYHREFFDNKHPFFNTYNKEFDKINYFENNLEEQYYKYYFNNYNQEMITNICKEYVKILIWNFQYYIESEPPSWNYYYKYRMPPLFKDLYKYLKSIDKINVVFLKGIPIEPLKQLMLILQKKSNNIFPPILKNNLLKTENIYQDKFILDVLNGHKYIYSEPILEDFEYNTIEDIYNKNKKFLSKEEYLRNKINKPQIFNVN